MKILISLSYYMPNISGLTVYAARIADGLVHNENNVTVVTSLHNPKLPRREVEGGVKILRIPVTFFVSKGPVMLTFPFRVVKPVIEADVINCHLPQFEGFMIALLGKMFRKRIVVTYQCDMVHGDSLLQKVVKKTLDISHLISVKLADSVIVLSDDYARNSVFLSKHNVKTVSVLPPIILAPENKKYKNVYKKKVIGKETVIIGYMGRLSSEKGVEYLLKSIDHLEKILSKKCILFIAGPRHPIGEETYLMHMELLFSKYSKKIIFLGTLPDESLKAFYKTLHVLVLPSISSVEAFGMVQAEAMLCGTPVVASDLPGVRVPIKLTGMGRLVHPKRPKEIAKAIAEIVRNRDRYLISRDRLDSIFSYKQTILAYEQILRGEWPSESSKGKPGR